MTQDSAENQKGPNINLLDHLPQPKRKIRSTASCFMSPSRALAQNQAPSNLVNSLLIDSGATTHILTSKEKFNNFNHSFNPQSHIVQLADGSKATNVVQGIGDATIQINDQFGESCDIKLKNVLFIPSFHQDIFSNSSSYY